jgi:tellurite resistance protein
MPPYVGPVLLLVAVGTWMGLLALYALQALLRPQAARAEFLHPISGSTPALLGISTLLIAVAAQAQAPRFGLALGIAGICWQLAFSLWHTGAMWLGGRQVVDVLPTLYLPTVAGNFTTAGFLGAYGHSDWGWLFMGAGVFAWLGMESLVLQRLWHATPSVSGRPAIGIQFAPAVVCASACLLLDPRIPTPIVLMLWGHSLFQMLVGARLHRWLLAEPYSPSHWAYTFGVASSAVCGCKLAVEGCVPAQVISGATFLLANLVVGFLLLRSVLDVFRFIAIKVGARSR